MKSHNPALTYRDIAAMTKYTEKTISTFMGNKPYKRNDSDNVAKELSEKLNIEL